ncbi:polysaccharide pyruvyl transferase family protein [Mesorhizobium sp. CAU 1732]|uniref:polysaccharide pyruvyl transferase family protein n=1 Tax=Mesorhizobium sp. CAU 1732 TaxID=3140358 RepID=UPI003261AAFD
MRQTNIAILDTAVGSDNLGDQIIMESVDSEIAALFPNGFVFRVPTHSATDKYARKLLRKADHIFAGGTNLLFSNWSGGRQWRLRFPDLAAMDKKLVLMGTGWSQYQSAPDLRTRFAYKRILSPILAHSLRDSYSVKHLQACGFDRLANTGCPTLWNLAADWRPVSSGARSDTVVCTITDYHKSPERDRAMIGALARRYARVMVWIQGSHDLAYLRELDMPGIEIIQPSLRAFDRVLESDLSLDYVGTRLHAGIRALQKGRRAIIVSIDNRAREMGRDFKLPTVEREGIGSLDARLDNWPTERIELPIRSIEAWRSQFMNPESADRN